MNVDREDQPSPYQSVIRGSQPPFAIQKLIPMAANPLPLREITPKDIHDSCVKNRLYTYPQLNDTLYLHFSGFQKIASLDPYLNLTSLWLNNNSINVIEGLSSLTRLVCLYLQGNVIQKIDGLSALTQLETLVLSHNYIKKIENLSTLTRLHTLEIDHNSIATEDGLRGLLEVPTVGALNLSDNRLESEGFVEVISQLPQINLLKLNGNPIARTMSQYRRRLLNAIPTLTYLDDAPVTETELRCAQAWTKGGREAESAERERIRQEKEDAKARNRREVRRMNRKFAIDQGIDISKDKSLMSSDDERLNEDVDEEEERAERVEEEEDVEEARAFEVEEYDDDGLPENVGVAY
jgi:dynein assembly factor 1